MSKLKLGTNTSKERKKLIKQCDDLVSLIVRKRDGRCVCCGSMENLTDGHLITRTCRIIRWDLTNNNCQCKGCNFRHEFRPEKYTQWWIKKYGMNAYDKLVNQSQQTKHWTLNGLELLKIFLTQELKQLEVDQ